jgi:hypothetical protein
MVALTAGRFAPTPIIISGDESVKDEIKPTADGGVDTRFSERLVFVANHLVRLSSERPLSVDLLRLALPLVQARLPGLIQVGIVYIENARSYLHHLER